MRKLSAALLLCGAYLWSGCQPSPTQPNVIVTQTQTVTGGTGSGPTGPSGPNQGGSLPPNSRAAIFMYGTLRCPSGVTPTQNGSRQIKLGCTTSWTCTPKDSQGNDLPAAVHGSAPAFFGVSAGADNVTVSHPAEPFNLEIYGKALGPFTVTCTVKDVTGTVDGAVIAATASAFDVIAMDGQPLPPGPPKAPVAPSGGPMGPGR